MFSQSIRTHLNSYALLLILVAASMFSMSCSGEDGANGATGPQGEQGPEGPAGPAGPAGADGEDGAAGADGTDGEDGAAGADGEDGAAGADGEDGATGADGADGENGEDGATGAPGFAPVRMYLSSNGADNAGSVHKITEAFTATREFEVGNNEGVELTRAGHLIQAGDTADGSSLRFFCAPEHRMSSDYTMTMDRALGGDAAGFVNPKGIAVSHRSGLVFVANFMGMNVVVMSMSAAGDAPAVATTALDGNPWDLTYDETNDRLYVALTNGTVAVFDNYRADGFTGSAARTITPSDENGDQISVNLHGIVYHHESDRLIVSDVGDAASATDGQLFVLNDASSADGNVSVARSIGGPATLLGNPVDIVLTGSDLRVAEKAGDTLLVFSDIFNGPSGDVAPHLIVPNVKPESLVVIPDHKPMHPEVSDINNMHTVIPTIAVSSNPGTGGGTVGDIVRMTSLLTGVQSTFDAELHLENVVYSLEGDVYGAFDNGSSSGGGIFIGNRAATMRSGATASSTFDRRITGDETGLVQPKGIDIDTHKGLLFVAEFNATSPAVLVFSTCADGNVAPIATADTAGARPWDLDYDALTDRLFVSFTNGTVGVYDQFTQSFGINGPDRLITPADENGDQISVNLHGVDYDPATDSLILSDVGDPGSATDGQLFVIPAGSVADGLTSVTVRIEGEAGVIGGGFISNLGNPVDIAYDGQHLYVAEKSNGVVMRFDNILTSPSGDIAPSLAVPFTAPESVTLSPLYLNNH